MSLTTTTLVAPLVESTEIGKYLHDGQKDWTQVLVARRSKAPFGRTVVKKSKAAKMGKKAWRENFGTIGVKVWSLFRSKFWKFDLKSLQVKVLKIWPIIVGMLKKSIVIDSNR